MSNPTATRRRGVVTAIVALGIIGALLVLGWYVSRDAAETAKVGDCVAQTGSDSIKVVDCGAPDAKYKVVGRVEGKTQVESTVSVSSVCAEHAGTEATYWQGEQGKKGMVLCLAKNS